MMNLTTLFNKLKRHKIKLKRLKGRRRWKEDDIVLKAKKCIGKKRGQFTKWKSKFIDKEVLYISKV